MISAKVILDSRNAMTGDRLITLECEYPLYIHNEVLTHRAFSRNSASSRAIPVEKRLRRVLDDPVIPTVWPKNEPGMSASENFEDPNEILMLDGIWRAAARTAVGSAQHIAVHGVHKGIANRIVEPWCWMKTIISATDWENFMDLRTDETAHSDFQELSYWMLHAIIKSTPRLLQPGEWHIPYADVDRSLTMETLCKLSVARCARISYLTHEGCVDITADLKLHDRLFKHRHMSPFEHQARAVDRCERGSGNFHGFHQYRHTIPGEQRKCDLNELYIKLNRRRRELGKAIDVTA